MNIRTLAAPTLMVITGALATPVAAQQITLESCNAPNNQYVVQAAPGTAGVKGTDYVLGTYLAGGNGGKGHGFMNSLAFDTGHFCTMAEPACFVSGPPAFTNPGALSDVDHNWLQGTTLPIVVDVGAANADDRAIVFNSTDHLGQNCGANPAQRLWDKVIEGIEFTVYGTNNLVDAMAAAGTPGVFSPGGTETGGVPGVGSGSTFEKAELEFVFEDGWADFVAANEGDDFASVWKFPSGTAYRYIAVFSNFTDPFIDDGFRSFDNELDAIGVFIGIPGQVLDHFKCYEAEGDPVNVTASLEDQFGIEPDVLVGEPELFCNPVDKNGEGIQNPEAHLTCYEIEDEKEAERNVFVNNQFGEQILEVEEPKLLCVPSEKISFEKVDDD